MLLRSSPDMVHSADLHKTLVSTVLTRGRPPILQAGVGIQSCCSGLQVQGTADSPLSTAIIVYYIFSAMSIQKDTKKTSYPIGKCRELAIPCAVAEYCGAPLRIIAVREELGYADIRRKTRNIDNIRLFETDIIGEVTDDILHWQKKP